MSPDTRSPAHLQSFYGRSLAFFCSLAACFLGDGRFARAVWPSQVRCCHGLSLILRSMAPNSLRYIARCAARRLPAVGRPTAHIRVSDWPFRHCLRAASSGLSFPARRLDLLRLSLPQAHPGAAAVFVDELDAGHSRARRKANSLGTVMVVSFSASSARRMVRRLTDERCDSSSALHRTSARAALI